MLRAALLLALVVPSLAAAQITVTETSDSLDDEIINIAECEGALASSFTFTWRIAVTGAASGELRVSQTSGCPNASDANTTPNTGSYGAFTAATGTTSPRDASTIPRLVNVACRDGNLRSIFFCAISNVGGTETATTGTFQIDGTIPTPPVINTVTPGDGALDVNWRTASNANRYEIVATPVGGGAPVTSDEITGTSHRITGLVNGTPYAVSVVGISIGGNRSDPSLATVEGTPVEVNDFWRLYRNSGGREEGGCSTAGGGALALLALVPLALRRKRS